MVPTLFGRIQTRLFLLATVGVVITLLIVPVLPGRRAARRPLPRTASSCWRRSPSSGSAGS